MKWAVARSLSSIDPEKGVLCIVLKRRKRCRHSGCSADVRVWWRELWWGPPMARQIPATHSHQPLLCFTFRMLNLLFKRKQFHLAPWFQAEPCSTVQWELPLLWLNICKDRDSVSLGHLLHLPHPSTPAGLLVSPFPSWLHCFLTYESNRL